MRSSDPVRPATARIRAGGPPAATHDQFGVNGSLQTTRPQTAPPTSGTGRAILVPAEDSSRAVVVEREEEEDAFSEADGDPANLLTDASTMLYQLQNTWSGERRAELERLKHQLQESYGFAVPNEMLEALLNSRIAGDAAARGDIMPGGPEAAAGPEAAVPAGTETEIEAEAEAVVECAIRELAAARELRQALEERQRVRCANLAGSEAEALVAEVRQPVAVGDLERPLAQDKADAERLAVLRREVERLKAKQQQQQQQQCSDLESSNLEAGSPSSRGSAPPHLHRRTVASNFEALDKWMEDMKLLASSAGCGRAVASKVSSPKNGSPPSRKAMAQVAEAKALEWAAEHGRSGSFRSSPSGISPTGSPSGISPKGYVLPSKKTMAQVLETGGASAGSSPSGAGSSRGFAAKVPEGHVTIRSPTGMSSRAGTSGIALATSVSPSSTRAGAYDAATCKASTEMQLDEILQEFDEIDRVYDGICRLSHG